jgi:hypothetical protein
MADVFICCWFMAHVVRYAVMAMSLFYNQNYFFKCIVFKVRNSKLGRL